MPSRPCCLQHTRCFSRSVRELVEQHRLKKPPYFRNLIISIAVVGVGFLLVLLVLFLLWFDKLYKRKRAKGHSTGQSSYGSFRKLHKYSYRELKKATSGFGATQKLGKGGYGVVYRGILKSGEEVAVKKLVLSSLQGEREFQNELSICRRLESRYVVKLLGFATHGEKVRLLVYECMQNRSLQEALLEKHTSVHLNWERRFTIIMDVARALAYLHLECKPLVIHGDVKPSNVLLDGSYRAYLADFGLARTKTEDIKADHGVEKFKSDASEQELGTPESLKSRKPKSKFHEERAMASFADQSLPSSNLGSPHSGIRFSSDMPAESDIPCSTILALGSAMQTETIEQHQNPTNTTNNSQTSIRDEEAQLSQVDNASLDNSIHAPQKTVSRDNWWWKQENSGELKVKDYVTEWMRSELSANDSKKGGPSEQQGNRQQGMDMEESTKNEIVTRNKGRHEQQKRKKARVAMAQEQQKDVDQVRRKERAKGRKSREWWKDEYFAELSKKRSPEVNTKGKKGVALVNDSPKGVPVSIIDRLRIRDGVGSLSGGEQQWRAREGTPESVVMTDDLSTTTTSMRGTVCYVAPEFGGIGVLSEASDIYSFGVLLLVIISGRRPIEIMAGNTTTAGGTSSASIGSSPRARRFERANLITWARSLAHTGNVLELVDDRLQGVYPREQAQLCIALALLCIRRLPSARPSVASIIKTLSGEIPPPPLPMEFSPSPPSRISLHQSPLGAASVISSSEDMV